MGPHARGPTARAPPPRARTRPRGGGRPFFSQPSNSPISGPRPLCSGAVLGLALAQAWPAQGQALGQAQSRALAGPVPGPGLGLCRAWVPQGRSYPCSEPRAQGRGVRPSVLVSWCTASPSCWVSSNAGCLVPGPGRVPGRPGAGGLVHPGPGALVALGALQLAADHPILKVS